MRRFFCRRRAKLDRALGVVVQNRLRHLAEELERRSVARAKRLRRLRRIGLHEAGIAVRQVHSEEMDLLLHPADDRPRLAEVRLRMAGSCRSGTNTSRCRWRRS